ncbi:MAG: antitoxin Xre/MbcA/ParS toxin-binding domain-containing protein [Betaproteobacteria bacterium]
MPVEAPDRAVVLTKAVTKAARLLDISQARIAQTLGVSEATASRMYGGKYVLEPGRGKEWELAALLVRLFRSLDSLLASEEKARAWLKSENAALGARPIDLITRAQGLVSVLQYLDAARGRI